MTLEIFDFLFEVRNDCSAASHFAIIVFCRDGTIITQGVESAWDFQAPWIRNDSSV